MIYPFLLVLPVLIPTLLSELKELRVEVLLVLILLQFLTVVLSLVLTLWFLIQFSLRSWFMESVQAAVIPIEFLVGFAHSVGKSTHHPSANSIQVNPVLGIKRPVNNVDVSLITTLILLFLIRHEHPAGWLL